MMDASKPPLGTRMKTRAPPPPQAPQPAPRRIVRNTESRDGTSDRDAKENMLSTRVELRLTLPSGVQTTVTEDGSTALMDVLVDLCSRYHLNPSLHTLELFTPEGHPLGFKPNVLLGSLNVARVLIKEKVLEDRVVRRPAPRVPEKTVRLLVNFHGSQKAVVRVNPLIPLQDLVPVICDKCELDPALTLLLKDSISRQELPLDKTLSYLGIKELYVHDKSLVLQPKMASAPALNYSDSIRSSTNSLARAEKKGLLGIFQFSRRKSKAMSTLFGSPYVDERPHTMGQSQSAINISRMSPKAETKKRRAPAPPGAPTPSIEHSGFDTNQMSLGSESQQRKRKAPAPPPTPVSVSSGSDDISAAVTPDNKHVQAPAPMSRTKVASSITVTATTVTEDMKTVVPTTLQAAECSTSLDLRSSTPSSTTSESLAVQDSTSELSQSLEDSDAASHCSTTTGSTVSGFAQAQSIAKSSVSRTEKSETTNMASDASTAGSSRFDTESAMNLKLEETENNRHSAVAWLHSVQSSAATGHSMEVSAEETVSLGSNSSGGSLPDQGYAASEGTADGEDSGLVSSPSETQTTSPDGSLSLEGGTGGDKRMGAVPDNSSDSDEGSWGSRHRSCDLIPHPIKDRFKDQDLSVQLHRTLAVLESSLRDNDEVPVSIVDHDVPVTTIDEVLPDEGFWAESITTSASSCSDELQNRNNNAHTAAETSKSCNTENKHLPQQKQKSEQGQSKTHKKEDTLLEPKAKEIKKTTTQTKPSTEAKRNGEEQKNLNKSDVKPDDAKIIHEETPDMTTVNQETIDLQKVHHNIYTSKPLQSKITPNVTSRFGMKTFTVVPPKPAVIQAAAGESTSMSPGAIKIDEQGNMVKVSVSHYRATAVSQVRNGQGSPLLGKAKAFWSSNEKQEGAVAPSKGLADKARDSLDCHKSARSKTFETTQRSTDVGSLKTSQGTLNKSSQIEHKETADDVAQQVTDTDAKQKDTSMAEDKISPNINTNPSSQRPAQLPFITDVRRDLSFLKPSRRTSSQYVASAITKHTPKTAFKPDYNPTTPEFLLKPQNSGFQKSGKSVQINPQNSFRSCNMNNATFTSNHPGPKKSIGDSEHTSSREEERTDETKNELHILEKDFGFAKGSFGAKEFQKTANEQSASSTQLTVKVSDTFKPVHKSTSPSPSRRLYSFDKSSPVLKSEHQEQAVNNPVTGPSSKSLKAEEKPSVTVTDSDTSPCPPAVTVFGPVKRFKPVICRSVEKETSLHSSLMEAIQNGGGKERLKKISTSGANLKKPSYVEEENERSALMAAIRDQSTSGRLRKTKSEAAEELENFRKNPLSVTGTAQVSSSSASKSFSPVQSSIPPPPPASTVAPPPPPPLQPAPKCFTLPQPNTTMNPAMAREAMLEAIRSGSAAEKLKKVSVAAKTVQVNGRLGTIKATSSTAS